MKVSLKSPITVILLACFALFLTILPAGDSESATMTDYCMTPPFIVGGVTPNLLLLLDNSASMYDLYYVDNGTSTRKGGYCYDQTYASTTAYVGYFDNAKVYQYDLAGDYFYEIATGVPSCASTACKGITDQLYIAMIQLLKLYKTIQNPIHKTIDHPRHKMNLKSLIPGVIA